MAESTDTLDAQAGRGGPTEKEETFVDEGFEVSEAPASIDADAAASKGSKKFVDEDSKSPEYRSDEWRMKNFKVVQCSKRYAHDWTICPFAHPGEKARRRDPKIHTYDGIACPDMKKAGFCGRGDSCPYAHNVFEYWLHPTRYRTQLCKDGTSCTRHVCFFAHTLQEMRPLPSKGTSPEGKKLGGRDGQSSPDTPLLTGSSENTASVSSSELWTGLSEERLRQSGVLSDDVNSQQSGSIDEVIYNLANVKMAMSGDKRNEVIKMLTQLLQEAVEEKQRDLKAPPTSRPRDSDVAGTLRGLNLQQAQALLAATQRRSYAHQVGETGRRFSSDWQQSLQDAARDPAYMAHNHGRIGSTKAIGNTEALYTAPAGLHQVPASSSIASGSGLDSWKAPEPNRLFSADLGLPPAYFAQPANLWQNQDALAQQHAAARPSLDMFKGMPVEGEYTTSLAPSAFLDGGFSSDFTAAANPNALRKQAVNLEENFAPPKSQSSRRPPASAFQTAASQGWKGTPGRGMSSDLNWANSASRASSDMASIKEGIPQLSRAQQDLLRQRSSMDASFSHLTEKSPSFGGFDTGFNRLSTPLSFTPQPQGGHNPALHSAPYDLSLAYSTKLDAQPQAVNPRRANYDRSALLQGWGGMNACDFGPGRY